MEPDSETDGQEPAPSFSKKERLQSSVQFPYGDLEASIGVAESMHSSGYRECAPDQLAAAMNQQVSSGNFRQKVSAARRTRSALPSAYQPCRLWSTVWKVTCLGAPSG